MNELRTPIREVLGGEPDEAAVQRIWARVSAPRRRAGRRWVLAGVAAAVAAGAIAAVWAWPDGVEARAPLALADGRPFVEVAHDSTEPAPRRVALSDGSAIELEPGVALQVARNEARDVRMTLTRGAAVFDVARVPDRSWVVDAAGVRVEVTGTRFRVERAATAVRVSVEEGTVVVRRPTGQIARLAAGDAVTVATDTTAALAPPVPSIEALPVEPPQPQPEPQPEPEHAAAAPEPAPPPTAEALMARADRARAARRPAEAVAPLSEVAARFPDDPAAPMAAFTLGVILLEELNQPAQAAEAFERSLELGLPVALTERAFARRVQAYGAAGDAAAARTAAEAYDDEFPDGRFADEVRQWSEP